MGTWRHHSEPPVGREHATRKINNRDFVPDQDRHPLVDVPAALCCFISHNGKRVARPATLLDLGWLLKNPRKPHLEAKRPPQRCAVVRDETNGTERVYLLEREWNSAAKVLADVWRRADGNGKLVWKPYTPRK